MTGSVNNSKADDWNADLNAIEDEVESQHTQLRRLNHDMRASLAITNGFNEALGTSLSDLVAEYKILLDSQISKTTKADVENVSKLEGDCRFCLSRITRSLVKLGEDIDSVTSLSRMQTIPEAETPEVINQSDRRT